MKTHLVLTIDIGTSSCKVCIFDAQGEILKTSKREYPVFSPAPGFAEQDPEEIYQAIKEAARETLEDVSPREVEFISFDTMLHSFLLVDHEGAPLYPLLNWMDTRCADEVEKLKPPYRERKLYFKNAAPLHTIYHIPRTWWFKENQPHLWEKASRVLSIKDWILGKITGELCCDYSTASATGLLNLSSFSWDEEILSFSGVSSDKLPSLVAPEHTAPLKEGDFTEDTGLLPGTPVIWGGGDGPFANLGDGAFREGEMVVTVGSSGAVRMCSPHPVFDPGERSWCYYLADGIWVGGGAINNGGIVYSWIKDLVGEEDWEWDIHRQRPIFLPFLTGERSPNWNAYARGVLFGLSYFHQRSALLQAAFEGVAFRIRSTYDLLQEIMGKPHRIVISGGFASSDKGQRVLCDVLGVPVELSSYPSAPAKGAFLLSCKLEGKVSSLNELPDSFFPSYPVIEPHPEAQKFYEEFYQFYQKVYYKNQELFQEFSRFHLA